MKSSRTKAAARRRLKTARVSGELARPAKIVVRLDNRARAWAPSIVLFRRWIKGALAAHWPSGAEISVNLFDKKAARRLNEQYRQRDYATNILSFPFPIQLDGRLLGDLVLCSAVIIEEARQQGKDLCSHYAHLTVHGVLHLLGFDHQTAREAERMENMEAEILEKFGIANPYSPL